MVPVLCLKNTFSPSPDNRWGGGSKNRTSLPIAHGPYIQAHLAEASGTLGTFLVPAGEWGGVLGSITREVGPWGNHSASGYLSLHLLVLVSFLVPSLMLRATSQQHLPTWLSLPPLS